VNVVFLPSGAVAVTVSFFFGARSFAMPVTANVSWPVNPRLFASCPALVLERRTPIPARFERWMRSKLLAITARTPRSIVPFAAQSARGARAVLGSREDDERSLRGLVLHRRVVDRQLLEPWGSWHRDVSLAAGDQEVLRRMFANVPRIMTSWFPRRAPYELKSAGETPCSTRYFAAGEFFAMLPAGEMWSVVTESPSITRHRAPARSFRGAGSLGMFVKKGGFRT